MSGAFIQRIDPSGMGPGSLPRTKGNKPLLPSNTGCGQGRDPIRRGLLGEDDKNVMKTITARLRRAKQGDV